MVTVTELNRAPDGRFKSVTSDSLTVNGTTDTDALNTSQLTNALNNRSEYSTEPVTDSLTNLSTTVTISGADFELLNGIPRIIRQDHQYIINIPDDPSLNILVPAFIVSGAAAGAVNEGGVDAVKLEGDSATPTNASINSIAAFGTVGSQAPRVNGFAPTGTVPLSDENSPVEFYGCSGAAIGNFDLSNSSGDKGVVSYGSHTNIFGSNTLGSDVFQHGLITKHGGSIICRDTIDLTGSVTGFVALNASDMIVLNNVSATGSSGKIDNQNGIVLDYTDNVAYIGPYHIEAGSVPLSPAAASDDSTDTSSNDTQTVTFGDTYNNDPYIVLGTGTSGELVTTESSSITTDDFLLVSRNYSTTSPSIDVSWLAIR